MTKVFGLRVILLAALLCLPVSLFAQEEGNADETTEVVEDAFQETFFEALKEKSIGNLEKAIGLLMRCKDMRPEEVVVSYELGRLFLEQKQFPSARMYLLSALESEPSNFWYLHAGVQLFLEQEEVGKAVALGEQYHQQGWEQQLLLARLYVHAGEYPKASQFLKNEELLIKAPVAVEELKAQLQLLQDNVVSDDVEEILQEDEAVKGAGPTTVEGFRASLDALAANREYEMLLDRSNEAVSNFPAQPEFYYFKGLALLKMKAPEKTLEVAEEGLAYLLEDNELELAFYRLMKEAYEQLGNDKKSREFEDKIGQKRS